MSKASETGREKRGLVLIGSLGVAIGLLGCVALPFLSVPARAKLGRIPWMATPNHIVTTAFSTLETGLHAKSPKILVDLGSGDGRLVIHAAKLGYKAIGYELNYVLVGLSYVNAFRAGVLHKVEFRVADFWKSDLSGVSVVACFGVRGVMDRLHQLVLKTTSVPRSEALSVLLFRFPLPESAKRHLIFNKDELFIYKFEAR